MEIPDTIKGRKVRRAIKREAKTLTDHQEEAFLRVIEPLLVEHTAFVRLSGYAGTGKTYLAGAICRVFDAVDEEYVVAAPTHKATSQVRLSIGNEVTGEIKARTVQSLLGLVLSKDGEGGYTLVPENEPKIPEGGVVIVDEASMISSTLWEYISATTDVRWLFVGDPGQLPPVKEDPSCVFELEGATLEEVVRQAEDNPILAMATRIRRREAFLLRDVVQYKEGMGVGVTKNEQAFLQSAINAFTENGFSDDPMHGRVLAYRNDTVDSYNKAIRTAVYGEDAPQFVEGEWLVANGTWYEQDIPVVLNSEMLRVQKVKEDVDTLGQGGQWPVWRLRVEPQGRPIKEITVLHEDAQEKYQKELDRFREAAETAEDMDVRRNQWRNYYAMREQYADVSPAYCSTIHKAQGCTFDAVWCDLRNIRGVAEPERSALTYVAATRPRERLGLLV
jgi:exodeoxyribonuclease-5